MGQLRSGIETLQKSSEQFDPKIKALITLRKASYNRVTGMTPRVSDGYDVLIMTLREKLKKEKSSFEASATKTIAEVADGAVATVIKGIIAAKNDIKVLIVKLNTEQKAAADEVLAAVNTSKSACDKLTALANKKKAKWLKSAKYKAKIGGYLTALGAVDADLTKLAGKISRLSAIKQDGAWVDKCFVLSANMKLSEIQNKGTAEFDGLLKKYDEEGDVYIAGFRDEYKHMGNQLASVGKWVSEADAMEKEADETK